MNEQVPRRDVPSGEVPDYRTFCRFVWSYRDEQGGLAVGPPPWMYAVTFDTRAEAEIAEQLLAFMVASLPSFEGRFQVDVTPDGTQVAFADLEILHVFLRILAARGEADSSRSIAEFMLWTLGFRWI